MEKFSLCLYRYGTSELKFVTCISVQFLAMKTKRNDSNFIEKNIFIFYESRRNIKQDFDNVTKSGIDSQWLFDYCE